jgi:hypothetical protein
LQVDKATDVITDVRLITCVQHVLGNSIKEDSLSFKPTDDTGTSLEVFSRINRRVKQTPRTAMGPYTDGGRNAAFQTLVTKKVRHIVCFIDRDLPLEIILVRNYRLYFKRCDDANVCYNNILFADWPAC